MGLRDVWRQSIAAADYDAHMDQNGQTQAGADLVHDFVTRHANAGERLWIAGGGTGGMFALLPPGALAPYHLTVTDINLAYLQLLRERACATGQTSLAVVVDDLERSSVAGLQEAVAAVLVLEHVDVGRALDAIVAVRPRRVMIAIQENVSGEASALVRGQTPVGTMAVLREVPPTLVPRAALVAAMRERGYGVIEEQARTVPQNKQILALVFAQD